jgi:phosphonate transport system permease protein
MFAAMGETIAIALAATLMTLVVSIVIGSLAARNVAPNRSVRSGTRFLLVMVRGIPEIILAIVLIVITGLGTQAGTIALAIGGVGLLGKLIADSFEEVKAGPERALTAAGASRLQVYAGATVPQGMRALIGHSFYMLDTNIRAATLLGIVGAGGVGYYLLNASQGSNYGTVTAIVLMILVTVLFVEGIAMWMRRVFR